MNNKPYIWIKAVVIFLALVLSAVGAFLIGLNYGEDIWVCFFGLNALLVGGMIITILK
jgi:hypothetical protein